MKRLLIVITVVSILCNVLYADAWASKDEVTVIIPDYSVVIDESAIYYADSLYPFLNYKGITYLPLTYEYARAMDIATGWIDGEALMVAYHPSDGHLPVYETTSNTKYNSAVIPTGYKVYVNNKYVDNSAAEYPLINFRGVTYFPVTWEYAVENFGWKISFEDNVFTIITGERYGESRYLCEKRENDFVVKSKYNIEVPTEDGWYKSELVEEYYSVDYKTGSMTKLKDYIEPEQKQISNIQLDIRVENGYAYYNNKQLDGIYVKEASDGFIKPDDVESVEYSVTGYITDKYEPLNFAQIMVYTANHGKESNWGTRGTHAYIESEGKLIYLGPGKDVNNIYTLGDDIYFNTVDYGQTTFRHYMYNSTLWKLSKNGQLTEIKYPDYNSMKIIGKAGDKLYLKCEWAPENPGEWGTYSVSLINDGYYTYNGQELEFVYPYIYSSFDVVSPYGDIVTVDTKLDKITVHK